MDLIDLEKEEIRKLMLNEFDKDVNEETVYLSKRLKEEYHKLYKEALRKALSEGTPKSLSEEISQKNMLMSVVSRQTKKGLIQAKMPSDASATLAEGEFNRYYIRGVCLKAIEKNGKIVVYRARHSDNPRPESEAKIGIKLDPKRLLEDLRKNIGIETHLGLPKPNSGLSVKFAS